MAAPTEKDPRPVIDRRALIDLSLAVSLIVSAFYVGRKMEQIEGSLRSLDKTLTQEMQSAATKQELELFKVRLQAANPTLVIPK